MKEIIGVALVFLVIGFAGGKFSQPSKVLETTKASSSAESSDLTESTRSSISEITGLNVTLPNGVHLSGDKVKDLKLDFLMNLKSNSSSSSLETKKLVENAKASYRLSLGYVFPLPFTLGVIGLRAAEPMRSSYLFGLGFRLADSPMWVDAAVAPSIGYGQATWSLEF